MVISFVTTLLTIVYMLSLIYCLYVYYKGLTSEEFYNKHLKGRTEKGFEFILLQLLFSLVPIVNTILSIILFLEIFSISEKINKLLPEHLRK